ncbi:MAG: hypothetical protein ABL995_18245 [Bryobacteraceae bacterium]
MKRWILATCLGSLLTLGGCAGARVGVYARTAPPPMRVENYGPAPGPMYVWVEGFWGWSGGSYNWNPGRWAVPPRGRRNWTPGRWDRRGDRYTWRDGRWR